MTPNDMLPHNLNAPLLPLDAELSSLWHKDAEEILSQNLPEDLPEATTEGLPPNLITQIAAIIYAAPHLHQLIRRFAKHHRDDITQAITGDITPIISQAGTAFSEALGAAGDDESVMRHLRHYRYRCYLALCLAELQGAITIQYQMKALSSCADYALQEVLSYLCRRADIPYETMVILGMGKLGAEELNYSSDIDLIILYDGKKNAVSAQDYVKLTRALIQIFQKQTGDGFAWRVDLRLRPDPGATAIALSDGAAISYYESIARSWERAVFVRARPVAGNLTLGHRFLEAIDPFIWRRQLDYSILSDLTAWITHFPMSEDGHNFDVKRGAFAIRHIEMMTHLLQVLHGGRDKTLRTHHTDKALDALYLAGHISQEQAAASKQLYWHWRALEHRLQYCRDAHIYHLPNNQEDFSQFARFAGFADDASLLGHMKSLQSATYHAASHPVIVDMIAAHQGALASGAWPADEMSQQKFLTDKGFLRPDDIIRTIESWMSGRLPATRSERARETLTTLLPLVFNELSKAEAPDAPFMGFAQFLEALPAGVQVFSLLNQHPQLIELISNFTLSAPALMVELTKNPQIFEQMLDKSFFAPLDERPDFHSLLADEIKGKPAELQLDVIRRSTREAKFRAEAHIITYPNAAQDAYHYLSDLADASLTTSFAITCLEFEAQYGKVADSQFAVLLLGRAGQRQLTPQSDIDLIFLYDGDRNALSDGPKQLSTGHYYQKLAQRFISWTSAKTASGSLYELDARLRPDGRAGPLATHYEGWQSYLAEAAWPFEKLALQKARLLTLHNDNADFKARIIACINEVTGTPIARHELIKEFTLLRDKMAAMGPGGTPPLEWDFKKRRGGLLDCEFLHHLGDETAQDIAALWHHLSLVTAVIMPKTTHLTTPTAFLQKELCRVMQQSSFDKALEKMNQLFDEVAQKLDNHLKAR